MLPKKQKLPIGLFPTSAKTILRNEYFLVKAIFNGLNFDRLGVTFKSKAFKTAALRNRLKRIVFGYAKKQADLASGRDLLIILNPPIINLSKSELNTELEKAIIKIQ